MSADNEEKGLLKVPSPAGLAPLKKSYPQNVNLVPTGSATGTCMILRQKFIHYERHEGIIAALHADLNFRLHYTWNRKCIISLTACRES